jgi:hypothetical protein
LKLIGPFKGLYLRTCVCMCVSTMLRGKEGARISGNDFGHMVRLYKSTVGCINTLRCHHRERQEEKVVQDIGVVIQHYSRHDH